VLALTVKQPWATLIAVGAKKVETRSWKTKHRGIIGIHAGATITRDAVELCFQEPFKAALTAAGILHPDQLPLGALLAKADLAECRETGRMYYLSDQERAFGDYTEGRYGWVFKNVEILPAPVPMSGALKLWEML
jgi:hypothetical protein